MSLFLFESYNKKSPQKIYRLNVDTLKGSLSILWFQKENLTKVIRLVLPSKSEVDNYVTRIPVKKNIPTDLMSLCETLKQYFQGQDVNFPLHLLHYDICSPFQRQVFMACTTIPRGKVITYGTLAKHLGDMRLSRAVGQTLAKNPFPIVIPCHRVVYFNGYIGGFSAGKDMKLWLLKNEGIYISKDRIRMENYLFDF